MSSPRSEILPFLSSRSCQCCQLVCGPYFKVGRPWNLEHLSKHCLGSSWHLIAEKMTFRKRLDGLPTGLPANRWKAWNQILNTSVHPSVLGTKPCWLHSSVKWEFENHHRNTSSCASECFLEGNNGCFLILFLNKLSSFIWSNCTHTHTIRICVYIYAHGLPWGLSGKESAYNAGDSGSIPRSGRSSG